MPRVPGSRGVAPALLLALAACAGGDIGESGTASALDTPDRTLDLRPETVYRVGGFEAPDWATFGSVAAARFDREGNLYILDSQANQVTVVAPDGSFLRTVGKAGEGPGELSSPFAFSVLPAGEVAIFDLSHRGFVIYGADGEFVRTVTVDIQDEGMPGRDLAYHASGAVVSPVGGRIRTGPPGAAAESGPPTRPVVYYPLSGEADARVVYEAWDLPEEPAEEAQDLQVGGGSFTVRMPAERAFEPGLGVGVLPDGNIVVSDTVAYRLKIVDLGGRVIRTLERPVPPTEVTEAIRRQERERRLAELAEDEGGGPTIVIRTRDGGGGQVDPEAVRRMQERRLEAMTFAEEIPVIEDVAVDPEGRIWVQRSSGVPGEDGPTDLLTPDGRYLGTIPSDGLRIPEAFGPDGLIVHIETDDFDVPTLVVERLPEGVEGVETDG